MEWVAQLVTGLFTAGGLTAIFAGYVRVLKVRHQAELKRLEMEANKSQADYANRRTARGDEIDVLQGELRQAREDIKSLRTEAREQAKHWERKSGDRDKLVNDLKSDHTAALLDMERCRAEAKHLTEQNKGLTQRVGQLEALAADLERRTRQRESDAGGGPGE